jgi:hypothetical protein
MDPVYGFQAVNVEAQLHTPTSLLRGMHRCIALRKEHPVFGFGTHEPIVTSNPRIFAVVRRFEGDFRALRAQPCALGTSSRARSQHACRPLPCGALRSLLLSAPRRAPVPADARALGLLLVPARRSGRERGRRTNPVQSPTADQPHVLNIETLRDCVEQQDFEQRGRDTFLEHYFAQLPAGEAAVANLVSIFELEKAIYELQYELDNRLEWAPIPVAGIRRLLESV